MDTAVTDKKGLSPRRAMRRRQLIQATIDCIAKRGFADTTLSHVSRIAKMNIASVNMYFTNKETLLEETLQFLCDDYKENWQAMLAKAKNNPADKLKALVSADFTTVVSDRKKLGVWFAFLGEAKTRPTYRRICEQSEAIYYEVMCDLVREIIEDGQYNNIDVNDSTDMIIALCDGLWLSLLLYPNQTSRRDARNSLLRLLEMLFPNHFPR